MLSACATVTRGSREAWVAESDPPGARVETTNGFSCATTPCSIRMPRRSEFTATFTKDGYRPVQVSVGHQLAGEGALGMAGNVLVGGVIGLGVDVVSGASQDLHPNPVHVTMEALEPGQTVADVTPAIYMQNDAEDTGEMMEDDDETVDETYDPTS
jgi:hypothetical protein